MSMENSVPLSPSGYSQRDLWILVARHNGASYTLFIDKNLWNLVRQSTQWSQGCTIDQPDFDWPMVTPNSQHASLNNK